MVAWAFGNWYLVWGSGGETWLSNDKEVKKGYNKKREEYRNCPNSLKRILQIYEFSSCRNFVSKEEWCFIKILLGYLVIRFFTKSVSKILVFWPSFGKIAFYFFWKVSQICMGILKRRYVFKTLWKPLCSKDFFFFFFCALCF